MSEKQINQWRTVGVVVGACITLAATFAWTVYRAGSPLVLADVTRLYETMSDGIVWLIAALVVKRVGEGFGLKLTREKPEAK